jgi:hypothetical protein
LAPSIVNCTLPDGLVVPVAGVTVAVNVAGAVVVPDAGLALVTTVLVGIEAGGVEVDGLGLAEVVDGLGLAEVVDGLGLAEVVDGLGLGLIGVAVLPLIVNCPTKSPRLALASAARQTSVIV